MPVNSFDDYPMSWKPKLKREGETIYNELISLLKEDIKRGNLLPGTKLPPQRELADFLDINISTVSRAFKKCEEEGILTSAVGSGTFVAYGAITPDCMKPHSGASGTIEMGALSPVTFDKEILGDVLKEVSEEADISPLFEYRYDSRSLWHREAAVRLMSKCGFKTRPETILFSAGGQNALTAVLLALFKPGDRLGTDEMVFPGLKALASFLGIRLVPIRSKDGEFTEEGLLHAIKNENIKGIYAMSDFQNPTTHTMSERCKDLIARVAVKYELPVIEDPIFSAVMKQPVSSIAGRAPEHTIYISSISKIISPGLRVAYISAPERYQLAIENSLANINLSVSPLTLEIASRIIAGERFGPFVKNTRANIRARNLYVTKILEGLTLHGSPECPFKWVMLPEGIDMQRFEDELHQDHVQINTALRFAVGKVTPPSAFRLCSSTPRTIEDLETGLEKIAALETSLCSSGFTKVQSD